MAALFSRPRATSEPAGGRATDRNVLLRAGCLAGLMEGLAIARYDILMQDADRVFGAVLWVLIVTLVSLTMWLAIGGLLLRFLPADWRVLGAFGFWAAAVSVGRSRLGDRLADTTWMLVAAGTVLVVVYWLIRRRLAAAGKAHFVLDLAILLTASGSLLGRVPDQAHTVLEQFWFLASTALLAWLIVEVAGRWPRALGAATALLLGIGIAMSLGVAGDEGPNVLWILVDTTRRDHVQPYADKVLTPAISRLAEEGVLFRDAVTVVPKTPGSVASFFTARYPPRHGVRTLHDRLSADQDTAAEAFRKAGFDTAAFINNGWISRGRGFEQGFERFMGYFEVNRPYGPLRYVSWLVAADQLSARRIPRFSPQTSASSLTDTTLQYLRTHRQRRFFAYVHYFEPHWPYLPPPELAKRYGGPESNRILVNFIGQSNVSRGDMIFRNPLPEGENEAARRLYKGEIDDTMFHIGRLLQGLDAMGLADNTIVAFTADHGHALGEHDYYFHHGAFLYEDSMRIPLIMRWPEGIPPGLEIDAQVRSIDLAPTLLRLASLPSLDADGESLESFWAEGGGLPRPAYLESDVKMFKENVRRAFPGIPGKLRGLRDGRFKLILTPGREGVTFELYDLLEDPEESINLAEDPEFEGILQALRGQLARLIPSAERAQIEALGSAIAGRDEREMSDEEIEMLRSLGYLQ